MKKIFIMNLGTTSFKFKLYQFADGTSAVLASGEVESVGAKQSRWELQFAGGSCLRGEEAVADHGCAFALCLDALQREGVLADLADLNAVGYKAVHGGAISGTHIVDEELLAEMERVTPLAPAHNPIYLSAMRDIRSRYPQLLQVARFETSFHGTIPDQRTTYGVPYSWREKWGIRKYGFHGSSHEYIAGAVRERLPQARRVISCHLGGSSSICAILDGRSIATTMGATPQSGLFQNNRVGDFDLFCLPMLLEHYDGKLENVLDVLSKQSGFAGLSGVSNDLRLVMQAMDDANAQAKLAVETFADNIVGYIGMFAAYLNGLDALVFTGGIGTNSAALREMVCSRLGYLGVELDGEKNRAGTDECVSTGRSRVAVLRLKTNEELVVARNVYGLLQELESGAVTACRCGDRPQACCQSLS